MAVGLQPRANVGWNLDRAARADVERDVDRGAHEKDVALIDIEEPAVPSPPAIFPQNFPQLRL